MNQRTISYNDLPEAISEVLKRISRIEEIFSAPSTQEPAEELLDSQQAADLLHITLPTLYNKAGKLPHYKNGKRLLFKKSELMEYVKTGRRKTDQEQVAATTTQVDDLLAKAIRTRKRKA